MSGHCAGTKRSRLRLSPRVVAVLLADAEIGASSVLLPYLADHDLFRSVDRVLRLLGGTRKEGDMVYRFASGSPREIIDAAVERGFVPLPSPSR